MPLWAIGGLIFKVVLFGGAAFLIFCFVKAMLEPLSHNRYSCGRWGKITNFWFLIWVALLLVCVTYKW
jgi:hypothetical protein